MKLADLAAQQVTRLADERTRNRERFPFAAEMLDVLKAGGIDARIVYAENAVGETIGKSDRAGEVDGIAWVKHADAHARWFGGRVVNRQPEAAPKRRAMTDAQCACLRGDV